MREKVKSICEDCKNCVVVTSRTEKVEKIYPAVCTKGVDFYKHVTLPIIECSHFEKKTNG